MHTYSNTDLEEQNSKGPARTLTAALERLIKQLLVTYSTTQVKYYKQTRKLKEHRPVPPNANPAVWILIGVVV